jgi:hypothetical protein
MPQEDADASELDEAEEVLLVGDMTGSWGTGD